MDHGGTLLCLRLLINGAELIAIHKGRYYSRGDGLAMGPGPFVNALEYASGKTACVLGKPEKSFFYSALEGLNCEPHEVVMIGDVNNLSSLIYYLPNSVFAFC